MAEESKSFKNKVFLVVEDDPVSSEFLKEIFEDEDVHLKFSNTGENAVSVFKTNDDIDLVLMDIRLPGISGYETTRQLKSIKPDVPVIAQTAYALEGDRQKAIDAGCDDYISKPIKASELRDKINNLI